MVSEFYDHVDNTTADDGDFDALDSFDPSGPHRQQRIAYIVDLITGGSCHFQYEDWCNG